MQHARSLVLKTRSSPKARPADDSLGWKCPSARHSSLHFAPDLLVWASTGGTELTFCIFMVPRGLIPLTSPHFSSSARRFIYLALNKRSSKLVDGLLSNLVRTCMSPSEWLEHYTCLTSAYKHCLLEHVSMLMLTFSSKHHCDKGWKSS